MMERPADASATERAAPATTVGIVVVTHGESGAAMLAAAEQVAGPMSYVRAVGVPIGATLSTVQGQIDRAVAELGAAEVLFLVDLGGSTPANVCCKSCGGHAVVLSGVNLPMLFKLATADKSRGARSLAAELAATGTKSISVREEGS
jgi:PTS system mannose-specific IIA component